MIWSTLKNLNCFKESIWVEQGIKNPLDLSKFDQTICLNNLVF